MSSVMADLSLWIKSFGAPEFRFAQQDEIRNGIRIARSACTIHVYSTRNGAEWQGEKRPRREFVLTQRRKAAKGKAGGGGSLHEGTETPEELRGGGGGFSSATLCHHDEMMAQTKSGVRRP